VPPARRERAPDSRRTIDATDSTMAAAPIKVVSVISSDRTAQPSTIAITGLTYA
jgi:hypothetical protein